MEPGRTVLDVGCGAGKPIDAYLVQQGCAVNGIDISERMVELARRNVPQGFFEVKDMTQLKIGEYCVDGIVSFYAIFHTPRETHGTLLKTFASFMPNGGPVLLTMGVEAWEGTEENFHGVNMYWSQFGAEKNLELVRDAGFTLLSHVIDGAADDKQLIILAKL